MKQLSILIPARNEQWLQKTIDDIFLHSEADTEVIVGLDESGGVILKTSDNPKLRYYCSPNSIGQRAMTNLLARNSTAKYVMKLDGHCSFAQGFDRVLLESMDDNTVMTPMLCRLDAKEWNIIPQPFTKKYYFDTNMVFQYGKQEDEKDSWGLVPTMSLQGSCFIVSREKYWEWNLCDEAFGSWGGQGSEVAIKTFLNGGRVVTNTDTFYGHLFRGAGQSVEEIPYERKSDDAKKALDMLKADFSNKSIAPLIEKFGYPCDWRKEYVDRLPD